MNVTNQGFNPLTQWAPLRSHYEDDTVMSDAPPLVEQTPPASQGPSSQAPASHGPASEGAAQVVSSTDDLEMKDQSAETLATTAESISSAALGFFDSFNIHAAREWGFRLEPIGSPPHTRSFPSSASLMSERDPATLDELNARARNPFPVHHAANPHRPLGAFDGDASPAAPSTSRSASSSSTSQGLSFRNPVENPAFSVNQDDESDPYLQEAIRQSVQEKARQDLRAFTRVSDLSSSSSSASSKPAPSAAASEEDEDDAELQAAIKLSMQVPNVEEEMREQRFSRDGVSAASSSSAAAASSYASPADTSYPRPTGGISPSLPELEPIRSKKILRQMSSLPLAPNAPRPSYSRPEAGAAAAASSSRPAAYKASSRLGLPDKGRQAARFFGFSEDSEELIAQINDEYAKQADGPSIMDDLSLLDGEQEFADIDGLATFGKMKMKKAGEKCTEAEIEANLAIFGFPNSQLEETGDDQEEINIADPTINGYYQNQRTILSSIQTAPKDRKITTNIKRNHPK